MPEDHAEDLRPDIDAAGSHGRGRLGSVIRRNSKTGERRLDQLTWGLLPHGTRDPASAPRPIHARAETVATLPMFADAFQRRRAIVPATVYYQQRTVSGPRQRFAISRVDGRPMAFAGLWEAFRWPDGDVTRSYCIITVPANALLAPIHDRMPLALEEHDWPVWLGEQPGDPASLLHSPATDVLQCRPVGKSAGKSTLDPSAA